MNELCMIIKDTVKPNFLNIKTSIQSYDRNALCCGAPCWRWAYHALHSADKWFINPFVYDEPFFHEEGMDNPDNPCTIELSDEQLLDYLEKVEKKTLDYIDTRADEMQKLIINDIFHYICFYINSMPKDCFHTSSHNESQIPFPCQARTPP